MIFEGWNLLQLDLELGKAARRWVRWRRLLRSGAEPASSPFADFPFVSRLGFEHFADRPASDPLRAPALRWLYRLVDDKACLEAIDACERTRRREQVRIERPERALVTLAEVSERALGDRKRSAEWWAVFVEHAPEHAGRVREYMELRADIASRLKLRSPDELELPSPDVYDVAEAWLAATDDAGKDLSGGSLERFVELGLGLEAAECWPAQLTPRSLADFFRESSLLQSLSPDLGELPARLGPASFLRALARLGAATVDAAAPARQPFVVAYDPFGLRRRSFGALLAMLPHTAVFASRVLGVARSRMTDHRRALGRALLLGSRASALALLLRPPALRSSRELGEAFEAGTERVLGAALPGTIAGAIFRPRRDGGQRFAGLLLGALEQQRLVEEHDEDWFRNPRAIDELRSTLELPPETTTSRDALERGVTLLRTSLYESLG